MCRYNNLGPHYPLSQSEFPADYVFRNVLWSGNFRSGTWNDTEVTDTSSPSSPPMLLHQINSWLAPRAAATCRVSGEAPARRKGCDVVRNYCIQFMCFLIQQIPIELTLWSLYRPTARSENSCSFFFCQRADWDSPICVGHKVFFFTLHTESQQLWDSGCVSISCSKNKWYSEYFQFDCNLQVSWMNSAK